MKYSNIELTKKIISIYSSITGIDNIKLNKLIKYVTDRLGHDKRYAIDITKIKMNLTGFQKQI